MAFHPDYAGNGFFYMRRRREEARTTFQFFAIGGPCLWDGRSRTGKWNNASVWTGRIPELLASLLAKMLIIGHRGAAGHAPENTLPSVRKALELNVDAVEVDVHLSKDDQLIVLHDSRLDRTTDGSGVVSEHCLEQIRSLNAGNGHRVPTLGEVLDLIAGRVPVNIEIKSRSATRFAIHLLHEYLERYGWSPDRFFVSSFDSVATAEAHRLDPRIPLGLLVEGRPDAGLWREAERQQIRFVGIDLASVTCPLVEEAHRRGFQVLVYTVNTIEHAKELMQIAVDGIFTDYPDRVVGSGS